MWPSLLLAAGMVLHAPPNNPQPPEPVPLRPGMTAAEVLERLGPPKRVARQVLYKRCLEQWLYETPAVRIEFDSVQGRPSQILTVHPNRLIRP